MAVEQRLRRSCFADLLTMKRFFKNDKNRIINKVHT